MTWRRWSGHRVPTPAIAADNWRRRAVDVVVAAVGLIGLSPVLSVLCALVRMTSPGPVLFRQSRVGRLGDEFQIVKLRTMTAGPIDGPLVSGPADPRITPIGSWLRRTRLDELPQLVNLLRGELTLIGPRPEVPQFVAAYTPRERDLLRARPGIIGPGALLFAAQQAAELDSFERPEEHYVAHQMHPRLSLDLDYLEHRSLRRDIDLFARAVGLCWLHRPVPARLQEHPRAVDSGAGRHHLGLWRRTRSGGEYREAALHR